MVWKNKCDNCVYRGGDGERVWCEHEIYVELDNKVIDCDLWEEKENE